jgi:hypothetical protein
MAYDVFISFKNSGKDGTATPDALAARKVYEALKGQGIKAFFSEESLAEEGRGHFSKSIEKALDSSRVLVLVASCREHIESQWVEAEWDSFAQDIRSGNKKGELFIYNCGALKPNDLPLFLRRQQMFPEGGIDKLIKFVSSAIPSAPTLDSYIQLSLHCFHPEKNEDKVYFVTVQPGSSTGSFNVTAHWGARSAKRLSSQVKAVNASDEKAKVEIEKAKQEKLRGGYSPADHGNLLSDEARSFLAASLGLNDEAPKVADAPKAKASAKTPSKGKVKVVDVAVAAPKSKAVKVVAPKPAKVVEKSVVAAPVKAEVKSKSTVKPTPTPTPAPAPAPAVATVVAPVKVKGSPVAKVLKGVKDKAPISPTTPSNATIKPKVATAPKPVLKGKEELAPKTVCISGKLPSGKKKAEYLEPLRAKGYSLVDDVVKGLAYLVLADPDTASSKSEKAKKMGVKLISEAQLVKLVK